MNTGPGSVRLALQRLDRGVDVASTTRTVGGLAILLLSISSVTSGQAPGGLPSAAKGDWIYYNSDLTGSKYSPLDQINAANVNKLEVAWRFKTDVLGPRP